MLAWIPRKLRYLLTVLMLLSMAVPTGISHDTVITGHTVFKNAAGYDKCLASIVGLARSQVLWFNDQTLVETDPKGQYVYAVRGGAPAPPMGGLEYGPGYNEIYGNGVVYEFIDPNGHRWIVLEGYFYTVLPSAANAVRNDRDGLRVDQNAGADTEHVWVVQIQPTHRDNNPGADLHEFYNFVTIVDTCKFRHGTTPEGKENHTANDPHHPAGELAHSHDVYEVDLYIGKEPRYLPIGHNMTEEGATTSVTGRVTV